MITLFMEMWCAFWAWATGRVDDDSPWKVWDILWRDGGEWYARPAGQHREGFAVTSVLQTAHLDAPKPLPVWGSGQRALASGAMADLKAFADKAFADLDRVSLA